MRFTTILTGLFFFFLCQGQTAIYEVVDSSYVFEKNRTFTIDDLLKSGNDTLFKPLKDIKPRMKGVRDLDFWTRVKVRIHQPGTDLAFRAVAFWVNSVEIYRYDDDSVLFKQEAGLFMPEQKGGIHSGPYLLHRIPYSSREQTFYLHFIHSEARPGMVIAGTYEQIITENNFFYSASRFILAILLIVFLLAMTLYITSAERLYLYYALHVMFVGLFAMMDFGIIIRFMGFRPNYLLYLNMYTISFVGSIFALMFYTRTFFNTKVRMPRIDKTILILVLSRTVLYLVSLIPGKISFYLKLNLTYWDIPLIGFAFITGIYAIIQKERYAWLFSFSFFVLLLSVVLPNFIGKHYVNINILYLSLVLTETLLFFFAITYRLKVLNMDRETALLQTIDLKDKLIGQLEEYDILKDKINRELEYKVAERTEEIKTQAEKIEQMNSLLQKHNIELTEDIANLERARVMQQSMSFEEFKKTYPDDRACYHFLSEQKWGKDYTCKKCGHNKYSIHDESERRKCSRCNYIESPTTDTLFHNVKFPIHKAFYLLYLFSTGKSPSFEELSRSLNIRIATIWSFKKKVDAVISEARSYRKSREGWTRLIFHEKK